jgi:hypothetical protein
VTDQPQTAVYLWRSLRALSRTPNMGAEQSLGVGEMPVAECTRRARQSDVGGGTLLDGGDQPLRTLTGCLRRWKG